MRTDLRMEPGYWIRLALIFLSMIAFGILAKSAGGGVLYAVPVIVLIFSIRALGQWSREMMAVRQRLFARIANSQNALNAGGAAAFRYVINKQGNIYNLEDVAGLPVLVANLRALLPGWKIPSYQAYLFIGANMMLHDSLEWEVFEPLNIGAEPLKTMKMVDEALFTVISHCNS